MSALALDPSTLEITSPRGHKVTRTFFRDTAEYPARVHWLAARKKILTSTDVAAVLGWDSRKSAYAVYVDKTTGLDLTEPDLAEVSEAVRWGMLLEDEIAKEAGRRLGRTLIDHGRHTIFWTTEVVPGVPVGTSLDREIQVQRICGRCGKDEDSHEQDPPCREATCRRLHTTTGYHYATRDESAVDPTEDTARCSDGDRMILVRDPRGPGVGEGKTTGEFTHGDDWKPTEDDEIGAPLRAQVQVQVSMAVLGWEWAALWGLLGGFSFHLEMREIDRDPDFLPYAIPRLQEFWKRVENRDPPPVDGSESTYEALKRQYPRDSGFEKPLPVESLVWDGELVAAKKAVKEAEAEVEKYRNLFMGAIGDARVGVLPNGARYSLARTKDPKPRMCPDPKCGQVVEQRKASRPLKRLSEE